MPFIIWGSRGITSTVSDGHFFCPQCNQSDVPYTLKQVRPFFTLFFIPIFPIGSAERYVECARCRGTFREAVLELRPPTEGERLLAMLYDELQTGTPVEVVQNKLKSMGLSEEDSASLIEKLTEGKTWTCPACGNRYVAAVKRCTQCAAST